MPFPDVEKGAHFKSIPSQPFGGWVVLNVNSVSV